jgi:hypothetical protein
MHGSINLVTKIRSFNSAKLAGGGRRSPRPGETPPFGDLLRLKVSRSNWLISESMEGDACCLPR